MPADEAREALAAIEDGLNWTDESDRPLYEEAMAGLAKVRAALDQPVVLDVRRVKQAVTNIAVRHGVVKDPPPPNWSLMHLYGYSRATPDMDAEIAAEYARLSQPDATEEAGRHDP